MNIEIDYRLGRAAFYRQRTARFYAPRNDAALLAFTRGYEAMQAQHRAVAASFFA